MTTFITTEMRTQVAQLYASLFNRAPESEGLGYWVSQLASGKSFADVAQAMYLVQPARETYPLYLTNEEIVAKFYVNVLGRTADEEGLAFWKGKLDNGETPGAVISKIITAVVSYTGSDEAALTSKALLENKVAAGLYYAIDLNGADVAKAKLVLASVTADPASVDAVKADLTKAPGASYNLTAGVDAGAAFIGGNGDDSFNALPTSAGANTFTAFDKIDGGAGEDTLNIVSLNNYTVPSSATVVNVEKAAITADGSVTANVTAWTGLQALNVGSQGAATLVASEHVAIDLSAQAVGAAAVDVKGGNAVTVNAAGVTTGTISVASATDAVKVSSTVVAGAGAGAITVNGGKTVEVTQAANSTVLGATVTQGAVNVTGGATTTSVNVYQSAAVAAVTPAVGVTGVAGIANGAVTITDLNSANTDGTKANTIASVSLSGYDANATINSNALTHLDLANSKGDVTIVDNSTKATATTLDVKVNNLGAGADLTAAKIKTLNIEARTKASSLSVAAVAATTVTVTGDQKLDLTGSTMAAVTSFTSTNSGGVTVALNTASTGSFGAGADVVTVGAAASKAITLGAGNDTAIVTTLAATGKVDGGEGTDTLSTSYANAVAASADAAFAAYTKQVTGFEILKVGATDAAGEIKLANLSAGASNAFNEVDFSGAVNHAVTISGLTSGATIGFEAGNATLVGAANVTALIKDAVVGTAEVLNVKIANTAGINVGTISAAGVETVNFMTDDKATTATGIAHSATLEDAAATTITVAGDAGLNLTFTGTSLTSFDASGVTKGAVSLTTGALANAATIKGGAEANTFNFAAATKAVTYTGGAGVDTINAGNAASNTISTGEGADVVVLGSGKNVVDLGAGNDTVTLGSNLNVVTLGAGDDIVNAAITTNGNTYSTLNDFAKGDTLSFAAISAGTVANGALGAGITLADTAQFADFLNAATAGDGGTNGLVKWFQFSGNTYVVLDNSAAVTYQNGVDTIVKLVGAVDLSTATLTSEVLAIV
jgi:S-layer protein